MLIVIKKKKIKNQNLAVRKAKTCLFLLLMNRKVSCLLHDSENVVVTELQHFTSARWAKLLAISFQNAEVFDHMKLILCLPLIQNKKKTQQTKQFMYYFWHQIIL